MFAFVVLGAGLLFFLGRLGDPPARPAQARTPAATFDALLKDASHVKGSPDAPLTIIEFADFECPSCRRAYGSVASRFGKTIPARFVFRHLPLEMHPTAFPAAVAAEAAARQHKFWEMYDALFDPKAPPLDDAYLKRPRAASAWTWRASLPKIGRTRPSKRRCARTCGSPRRTACRKPHLLRAGRVRAGDPGGRRQRPAEPARREGRGKPRVGQAPPPGGWTRIAFRLDGAQGSAVG